MPRRMQKQGNALRRVLISNIFIVALLANWQGCARQESDVRQGGEIIVAAASSLTDAFNEMGRRFTEKTGIRVTFSYGATGDLAHQIENGAPFDLFASADAEHTDALIEKKYLQSETRSLFATGRLVLWRAKGGNGFALPEDVADSRFKRIAIAKPDAAPYGRAAVETLKSLGIWRQVEPKIVYAQTVAQAKQFAATGNADAAFIPLSLVSAGEGEFVMVDERAHAPITHTITVVKVTKQEGAARLFIEFLMSVEGQTILEAYGYQGRALSQ